MGWGCTGNWEGTHSGQLTQSDQRDTPNGMASCLAIKAEGKSEGRMLGVMAFVFTKPLRMLNPALLGGAEHLFPMGSSKWNSLFSFAWGFCFTPKQPSLSQPMSFSSFTFLIPNHIASWEKRSEPSARLHYSNTQCITSNLLMVSCNASPLWSHKMEAERGEF